MAYLFQVDFHEEDKHAMKKPCCGTTSKLKAIKVAVSVIGISIFICVIALLRVNLVLTDVSSVIFALSLFALSLAWLPTVRNFIFKSRSSSDQVIYRNNASVLYHAVKIAGYCLFPLWLLTFEPDGYTFSTIFKTFVFSPDIWTLSLVIVACCSIVLCNMLTSLSTKCCCNRFVLNGASFISGPIIISVSIYLGLTGNALEYHIHGHLWNFTGASLPYITLTLSLIIWALPFLVEKVQMYEDTDYLLVPTEHLFSCYSVNSLFVIQHLFANYTPQTIFERYSHQNQNSKDKATTIFVCTTMYREAEYEMRRLLVSLRKLSLSEKLKKENVYLETHIFLDGGAEGGRLKEFALQLLSLVTDTLHVDVTEGTGCQTPYGLQMLWTVPGGMQIFFHFKDNKKVKAKKRWSQVMYLNYIIEHRTKRVASEQLGQTVNSLGKLSCPETKETGVVAITLTDENGNTSRLADETVCKLFNLTKDNLSIYSETPTLDHDTLDSCSVDSYGCQENNLGVFSSNTMTLGSLSRSSSFASIPDLSFYRESLKSNSSNLKDDLPDFPGVFEISSHVHSTEDSKVELDERSYILATDADMGFDADAVLNAMRLSNENLGIGGICGITHPIGKHQSPLVWTQMFEYFKGKRSYT